MNRRHRSGEQGEKAVSEALESLPEKHYLINNLVLLGDNGISHQMDHIYINKDGVFVFETKNYFGEMKGREEDAVWFHRIYRRGKFVEEHLPNPLRQNKSHLRAVKRVIGHDIPVYGFVVFVRDNASPLGIFSVIDLKDLARKMRLCMNETPLSEAEMKAVHEKLLHSEADVNPEMHLESVRKVKKEKSERMRKIRYAIESRKCPDCQADILIKGNDIHCPKCGYEAKLY